MYRRWFHSRSILAVLFLLLPCMPSVAGAQHEGASEAAVAQRETITVTDALGRSVTVPENPAHVVCSGAGCLRLITYLGAQDRVVAVDDMEVRRPAFEARPYALANPQFKELPVFGEFRGHDNPELIVALEPQPQVIFKTYPAMGTDPVELQSQTGIPVVVLEYGDLFGYREQLDAAIRTMARVLDVEDRGEAVIGFFDSRIRDLESRTASIPESERPTCFVGGIAYKGPHGLQSTEPTYPPFMFVHANNVAYDPNKPLAQLQHADVAKEQLIAWDPHVLFVDVSTIQVQSDAGAFYELTHDSVYQSLEAVRAGRVYCVLPYNWYTKNYGSIIANAYFIGSVLYPEQFQDVVPAEEADAIYTFLVGRPVFREMNESFNGLAFTRFRG